MGKPSSIDLLDDEFRQALNALLVDPRVSQLEATARVNALLAKAGKAEQLSKSSVNRYAMKMEEVGARLRQSREIADMWIGKLGSQPAGQVGHLLNEIVRNLAFDSAMHLAEGEEPADPKLIKELAISIERLEKAAADNERRAEQVRKRTLQEAAETVEKISKSGGMSRESIDTIKREILGIAS